MSRISKIFTDFMCLSLKVLFSIIFIVSFGLIFVQATKFNISVVVFSIVIIISLFLGYKVINMNMSSNKKLLLILIIGFILRVLWLINAKSVPASDFKTMYDSAEKLLQGDRSMFSGTAYIARFPHLTVMVLYMATIIYLFPQSNLLVMKSINLCLGIIVLFFIYLILKEIFDNKVDTTKNIFIKFPFNKKLQIKASSYALIGTLIGAIFPPFITYTAVFCSENIAMPFYLLSVYLFLLVIKNKKGSWLFILCGLTLAFGNLFRMVAGVIVIAYILYIFLYSKNNIWRKIKNSLMIIIPYAIIICLVSVLLQTIKVTEKPFWRGSEPKITSVLKGTNYKSIGMWNLEDAKFIEEHINNYDELESASREVIKERLTKTSPLKLSIFYLGKFSIQWVLGDLGGVLWSESGAQESEIKFPVPVKELGSMAFQLIYTFVLGLTLISVFNRKNIYENKEINLFYLIFCGYGLVYLFIESQPRYSYIVSWIFIILAINGVDYITRRIAVEKDK